MRERSQCICAVEMQIFFTQQCFDQHIIFPVADNVATAVDLKSLPTWNGCWNKYTKLKVMNGGYSSHFSCTSRKSNNIRASLLCTDLQLKSIPEELLHFYILSKKKKIVLDHPKVVATMTWCCRWFSGCCYVRGLVFHGCLLSKQSLWLVWVPPLMRFVFMISHYVACVKVQSLKGSSLVGSNIWPYPTTSPGLHFLKAS